jgi:CHASE2 domain-containing sensor protein
VELVVLLAIVLLVVGFFVQGTRGVTMIGTGVVLGSLAGLELAVREHFAGYKSHSTVLAGAIAVVVIALGFFLLPKGWPPLVGLLVAAIVFAAAFYLFREAFKRRSGGLGFR